MASSYTLPIPPELVYNILDNLVRSSECSSCLQTDLAALCASSKLLRKFATPYLYRAINLTTLHDKDTYAYRQNALIRTLSTTSHGIHTHNLLLPPTVPNKWLQIATHTPNLRSIQGVDTFFPEDHDEDEINTATNLLATLPLKILILHSEELPVRLHTLLTPTIETLVLGELFAEESSFNDLRALAGNNLKEVIFHDFDVDYDTARERDDVLASLPAMESLVIDYTLGFSLSGVIRYLQQSKVHATKLKNFEFKQQLRSGNSLKDIATMISCAKGLQTLRMSLIKYPNDPVSEGPEDGFIASDTLEEIEWTAINSAPDGSEDQFLRLVLDSLPHLPNLKRVAMFDETRGGSGAEAVGLEKEGYVFLREGEEVEQGEKRRVIYVVDAGRKTTERISEMKSGVKGEELVCLGEDGKIAL
jgi:hypothetical protein